MANELQDLYNNQEREGKYSKMPVKNAHKNIILDTVRKYRSQGKGTGIRLFETKDSGVYTRNKKDFKQMKKAK